MKICLINNLFSAAGRGGTETVVETAARAFEAAGHEVFIIAGGGGGEFRESGFKVYAIKSGYANLARRPKFLRFFWHLSNLLSFSSYFRIRAILRRQKPDLIITHNLVGIGFLTPLAIRRTGIRHYHTLHDVQLLHPSGLMLFGEEKLLDSLFASVYQAISRKLFSSPEKIISPSRWLLAEHEKRGFFPHSEKLVAPNPVFTSYDFAVPKNPKSKIPASTRVRLSTRGGQNLKFKFLFVGQIEAHKGILFLTEVFSKFGLDGAELTIVGDGSRLNELKKIVAGRGDIRLLGRKKRGEVAELMAGSDCLVVPSLCYENSPTVIYEAARAGLPVLASAIGGIPELLSDGRGLTFKPADSEDLASKLRWAAGHRTELEVMAARAKADAARFAAADYLKKILAPR